MLGYLVILLACIQLSSTQTTKPTVTFLCSRTTGTTPQNYISITHPFMAEKPLITLFVKDHYTTTGCMVTKEGTTKDYLELKLEDLKIPVTGTDSAVCGIDLVANAVSGQVELQADVTFYLTRRPDKTVQGDDYFFTITKADCDFAASAAATQTVKNVEAISTSGEPLNSADATQVSENVQLYLLKKDTAQAGDVYVKTTSAKLGDMAKLQVVMALPTRTQGGKGQLRVKNAWADETCEGTNKAVVLVDGYCTATRFQKTDPSTGFTNSRTTDVFTADQTTPFSMFSFDKGTVVCFSAEIDLCTETDAKCADGDTCKSKDTTRRRRSTSNSTTITVTSKILISDANGALSSEVNDCSACIHPRVFLPVVTVLLVLLVASLSSTLYIAVYSRRRLREFPMKTLSEENI